MLNREVKHACRMAMSPRVGTQYALEETGSVDSSAALYCARAEQAQTWAGYTTSSFNAKVNSGSVRFGTSPDNCS
jgi:hypothetical protein